LFVSDFWTALHKLTSIKLKLSTVYHSETDGSNEQSNKTINQSIRYHVQWNQKGWVHALPLICFDIMNTINTSIGFSPFQIQLGCSPCMIPPLVPQSLVDITNSDKACCAQDVITQIKNDVSETRNNLLQAKVSQAHFANEHRGPEDVFVIGDHVMLLMLHHHKEYRNKNEKCVTKFLPHFDGPYIVTKANPTFSAYRLDLPNSPNIFPTFHSSKLKCFYPNNNKLFSHHKLAQPGPILTLDGLEEYFADHIIDARPCGRRWQFLVHWTGYSPEHNCWLPTSSVKHWTSG
jgi:hypothetical protein